MKETPLVIYQGKTFNRLLRWAAEPYVYRPITGITKAAPAVITCPTHGLKDGQRFFIVSVLGMTQINAVKTPPNPSTDSHKATVVDANTIEVNDVNAANFTTYKSGGYVQYLTPVDLTGYTARMSIKDRVGGTELFRLDTTNSRIVLDVVESTITLTITAADTAALTTWKKGVYDLELVNGAAVSLLLTGTIEVIPEVTTT